MPRWQPSGVMGHTVVWGRCANGQLAGNVVARCDVWQDHKVAMGETRHGHGNHRFGLCDCCHIGVLNLDGDEGVARCVYDM